MLEEVEGATANRAAVALACVTPRGELVNENDIFLLSDLGALTRMEQAPYSSEDLLQSLLEKLPQLLASSITDGDDRLVLVRRAFFDALGFQVDEIRAADADRMGSSSSRTKSAIKYRDDQDARERLG